MKSQKKGFKLRLLSLFIMLSSGSAMADKNAFLTPEYYGSHALAPINAADAYALGYTGKGVTIAIVDSGIDTNHFKFQGRTSPLSYNFENNSHDVNGNSHPHGTNVTGIAAAARDGNAMHGVAYEADILGLQLMSAKTLTDSAVFREQASRGIRYAADRGADIINMSFAPNILPGRNVLVSLLGKPIKRPDYQVYDLADTQYLDAMRHATQHDVVVVVAAGNTRGDGFVGNGKFSANPQMLALAPFIKPGNTGSGIYKFVDFDSPEDYNKASKYIYLEAGDERLSNVDYSDLEGAMLAAVAVDHDNQIASYSNRCGVAWGWCLAAPGGDYYSADNDQRLLTTSINDKFSSGIGTSLAAPVVSGAAAVLRQAFPYMSARQIIETILTTTQTDDHLADKAIYGRGLLDLGKAIKGPGEFGAEGFADIFAIDTKGYFSEWSNDIVGSGGLTKNGQGILLLSGQNSYTGPTIVKQGVLAIIGSVASAVTASDSGIVSGTGTLQSLSVKQGGSVAPGNSIGTLNVVDDVTFDSGANYLVEIHNEGSSDTIKSQGTAILNGGDVKVYLEHANNLLSQDEAYSLLGKRYTILSAEQGISGQFDSLSPSNLFLGPELDYQTDQISLLIGRNSLGFADVAGNDNERAVASTIEQLGKGNSVYESLLYSNTAAEANSAFRQLTGQIHADLAAAQLNESRHLRTTLNERLQHPTGSNSTIKSDESGNVWGRLLYSSVQANDSNGISGYGNTTHGLMLGNDYALSREARLGMSVGFTRTSLHGQDASRAKGDNYHFALYGSKAISNVALRAGTSYSLNRNTTERTVNYGGNGDNLNAKYNSHTTQLFSEVAYTARRDSVQVEPFANLAYVNVKTGNINEQGGASALSGSRQNNDALLSVTGIRAGSAWEVASTTRISLNGELGWQHQYRGTTAGTTLKFNHSNNFNVHSAPVQRDAAIAKVHTRVDLNKDSSLSLGYEALLANGYRDNAVNARFNWRF